MIRGRHQPGQLPVAMVVATVFTAALTVAACSSPSKDDTAAASKPAAAPATTAAPEPTSPPPPPAPGGGPSLTAMPNPVPPGPGNGRTYILWSTGDDRDGNVFVSEGGKPQTLFATGARGSQEAAWIGNGSYEFRLYIKGDETKPLATVTVRKEGQ